jgi:hypothetical protein
MPRPGGGGLRGARGRERDRPRRPGDAAGEATSCSAPGRVPECPAYAGRDARTGRHTADYSLPAIGTLATQQRNAFRGPSYFNTDLSFFKNVPVPWYGTRGARLQLRIEAFNLFNKAHLANPVASTDSTLFGRVTGLRGGTNPRTLQIGAKFSF